MRWELTDHVQEIPAPTMQIATVRLALGVTTHAAVSALTMLHFVHGDYSRRCRVTDVRQQGVVA